MTTFMCFIIAMAVLYIVQVSSGGFDLKTFLSFIITVALLGIHVYLSTRKKAILGIAVPLVLILSFYPVYKLIHPSDTQTVILSGAYLIAIGCSLYIWYKARKDKNG